MNPSILFHISKSASQIQNAILNHGQNSSDVIKIEQTEKQKNNANEILNDSIDEVYVRLRPLKRKKNDLDLLHCSPKKGKFLDKLVSLEENNTSIGMDFTSEEAYLIIKHGFMQSLLHHEILMKTLIDHFLYQHDFLLNVLIEFLRDFLESCSAFIGHNFIEKIQNAIQNKNLDEVNVVRAKIRRKLKFLHVEKNKKLNLISTWELYFKNFLDHMENDFNLVFHSDTDDSTLCLYTKKGGCKHEFKLLEIQNIDFLDLFKYIEIEIPLKYYANWHKIEFLISNLRPKVIVINMRNILKRARNYNARLSSITEIFLPCVLNLLDHARKKKLVRFILNDYEFEFSFNSYDLTLSNMTPLPTSHKLCLIQLFELRNSLRMIFESVNKMEFTQRFMFSMQMIIKNQHCQFLEVFSYIYILLTPKNIPNFQTSLRPVLVNDEYVESINNSWQISNNPKFECISFNEILKEDRITEIDCDDLVIHNLLFSNDCILKVVGKVNNLEVRMFDNVFGIIRFNFIFIECSNFMDRSHANLIESYSINNEKSDFQNLNHSDQKFGLYISANVYLYLFDFILVQSSKDLNSCISFEFNKQNNICKIQNAEITFDANPKFLE